MGILNDIIRKELEKMLQEELKNGLQNVDDTDKKEPENVDTTEKVVPKSVDEKPKSEPEEPPASVDDTKEDSSALLAQIADLEKQIKELQKENRTNPVNEVDTDSDVINNWITNLERA